MTGLTRRKIKQKICATTSAWSKPKLPSLDCKVCQKSFNPTNNCHKKCEDCTPRSARLRKKTKKDFPANIDNETECVSDIDGEITHFMEISPVYEKIDRNSALIAEMSETISMLEHGTFALGLLFFLL